MKYEINSETLAILPVDNAKSKVIEKNNEYEIDYTPYKVMEHSCNYFGSSLQGRLEGTKSILGSIYKPPVLVEESKDIIFFPTMSPNLEKNSWISLNNIREIANEDYKTIIYFDNGKKVELDIPYLSIENQVLRATRLSSIYNKRKNKEKSNNF